MARTAADVLIEGIIEWGVDMVFGLPATASTGSVRPCASAKTGCASY